MRTWRVWIAFLAVMAAGHVGVVLAALCPTCQEMMFTCDIGRCVECGGDTASGGYQLCDTCSDGAGQCQACRTALTQAKLKKHKLPKDPRAVVIQYRTAAHILGRMLPASGPDLVILADGTVIVHDPFGRPPLPPERVMEVGETNASRPDGTAPKGVVPVAESPAHVASVEGSIDAKGIQELLRFILDENCFFEFDPRAAMDRYHASDLPRIADAASTVFTVTADGRTHEAWVYAVDVCDYSRSPVPELARMQQVYSRLAALRQSVIDENRQRN